MTAVFERRRGFEQREGVFCPELPGLRPSPQIAAFLSSSLSRLPNLLSTRAEAAPGSDSRDPGWSCCSRVGEACHLLRRGGRRASERASELRVFFGRLFFFVPPGPAAFLLLGFGSGAAKQQQRRHLGLHRPPAAAAAAAAASLSRLSQGTRRAPPPLLPFSLRRRRRPPAVIGPFSFHRLQPRAGLDAVSEEYLPERRTVSWRDCHGEN